MIPFRENLNGSILLKLSVIDGTYSLSEKKTVAIAILKYAEHSTPMRDEIVNALAFLGIDKGKRTKNEAAIPDTSSPASFFPNLDISYSSVKYSSIIIGKAVLIYTIKEKENPIKHKRQRTDVIF